MKAFWNTLPEYYLIILVTLAGYTPPVYIHPVCIGIIALLVLQIMIKNRISGLLLGVLFFAGNLYFLGALLSEFSGFPEFHADARALILAGLAIWIVNLGFSTGMIYKYATRGRKSDTGFKLEKTYWSGTGNEH